MARKKKVEQEVLVQEVKQELPVQQEDVFDNVLIMTDLEALKFGKMDAEIRNAALSMQLIGYLKKDIRTEFEGKMRAEDEKMAALNKLINTLRPEYEALIEELMKKYEIKDRTKMSIDPDTKIIRELD